MAVLCYEGNSFLKWLIEEGFSWIMEGSKEGSQDFLNHGSEEGIDGKEGTKKDNMRTIDILSWCLEWMGSKLRAAERMTRS